MYWMMLVAGIAGCALDAKTKIGCERQADCLDGYKCGVDRLCHATTCDLVACGDQCGEIDDGCGELMYCGACAPKDGGAKRLIFTTSAQYQGGKLGGLAGADAICQTHARPHFTGVFQAWLSDSTGSPSTRMIHGTGDYVLVDDTVVAHGWNDLVDGQLEHAVNLDETGAVHSAGETAHCAEGISAWTGTDFDGKVDQFDSSCGHWDDSNSHGLIGDTIATSPLWTGSCSVVCTESLFLYCVEQ